MAQDPNDLSLSHTGTEDSDLVDVDALSDDSELIEVGDDQSDFEPCENEQSVMQEELFEDEEDEMSMTKVGLHDLNTLRHLYRFGLVRAVGRIISGCESLIDRT